MNKIPRIVVGIDVGTHTGIAVWDREEKEFRLVATFPLHIAMERVKELRDEWGSELLVIYEDARKQKMVGYSGEIKSHRAQGAGSIKRDSKIWEDYLNYLGIKNIGKKPRYTKMTEAAFSKITGYTKRTSNHARDAAMMVFNF